MMLVCLGEDKGLHVTQRGGKQKSKTVALLSPRLLLFSRQQRAVLLIVGPIGCRPNRGFHHHLHPAVSRLSINSHIQAISALPPTYHTSPERGHYQGSSGDDKDNNKDTHKDKYEDKDKDRRKSSCIYKFRYSVQQ